MAALDNIPFLGGYMQMDAVNRGREGQQLDQVSKLAAIKDALENGPVNAEILKAQLEEHKAKIAKAAQERAMMQQVLGSEGGGANITPEKLDQIGQMLAVGGHPGAATVMSIADKRRAAAADAQAMGTLRSQGVPIVRGVAPDEASAVAAINAGGGQPMSIGIGSPPPEGAATVQQGGLFAPYFNHPNPGIAQRAQFLQAALDKSPDKGSDRWMQLASQLSAQAAQFGQQQGMAQFRVDNPPPKGPEPLQSVLGPDGKTPVLVPRSQASGMTPYSPSIAGAGSFTPETLEFTAKQYLKGDRQAIQGFARNATARIALQNAIVEEAAKQGMSPEATAAKMAEFAGTIAGSRTVGQRAANISLAATEAQQMLDIVQETSDKFSRTDFVPWNQALKAYESGTGSPEISAFGASVNALVNVYARAINPTGQPTVADKEHARDVINTVQSPAQVKAVLGIIRRELDIAKKAPETVKEATRAGIVGDGAKKPADLESAVKAAGYLYQPAMYDYRINADGTVQRKKK